MPRKHLRVHPDALTPLRDLAARLGYLVQAGAGAGELGHPAALLEEVARRYEEDPDTVYAALKVLHLPGDDPRQWAAAAGQKRRTQDDLTEAEDAP
jgi:alkanesulfonate monooxygenase SsuD/methylene tetrahydromethanopterin reductase-like flavin-dependent oxidoreductase (luciferase family)